MKYLLDTHVLIWAAYNRAKLPTAAVDIIENLDNDLQFSTISLWEIALKRGMNRTDFPWQPSQLRDGLLSAGYQELPLLGKHVLLFSGIPQLHTDAFDRLLLAQAAAEDSVLLTADKQLAQYQGPVRFLHPV